MTTETVLNVGNSRRKQAWIAVLALIGFLGLTAEAAAQFFGPDRDLAFMPKGVLYKPYFADPHRVNFSLQAIQMIHNDIPETGGLRYGLKAGGHFAVLRVSPKDRPQLGWELSFHGGVDLLFDRESSEDSIALDGNLGLFLSKAAEQGWSYKLAFLHTSSHLGDEYIENTGRTRINYTREEFALGVSKEFDSYYRVYGETGWGVDPGNPDLQKPGRLQAGFEIQHPERNWTKLSGWYAAVDLQSMQERHWKPDVAFQTGLYLAREERIYRLGIEIYRGRPTVGEFFQDTEAQIAFGVWIDI